MKDKNDKKTNKHFCQKIKSRTAAKINTEKDSAVQESPARFEVI